MMARLTELGRRTFAEREEVKADRGGIWIAIAATVVLVGILVGIFSYFGVDFGAMWGSIKVERTPISGEALSSFVSWTILGTLALAMLITYTLLMRRHTSQRENCSQ